MTRQRKVFWLVGETFGAVAAIAAMVLLWLLWLGFLNAKYYTSKISSSKETAGSLPEAQAEPAPDFVAGMKLVNENVSDVELDQMKNLGITVIGGEWGMNDADPAAVRALLDRAANRGLKLIVNFSDEAAWEAAATGTDAAGKPEWQGERVKQYLGELGDHPAIYGFDISNEAGENLSNVGASRITIEQLRQATADVRGVNPNHPIIMRMHYWDDADGIFGPNNPFEAGIADIVNLNLYSNYTEDQKTPLLPHMIADRGQNMVDAIRAADPNVQVQVSLGAFQELPHFLKPTAADLRRDIEAARLLNGVSGISFLGWGPERYPDVGPGWSLTADGQDLLPIIDAAVKQQ